MKFKDMIPWSGSACKPAAWDPFREMTTMLGDMDRAFGAWPSALRSSPALLGGTAGFAPEVDVKETEGEYLFSASVPGVEKKNLHIDLNAETLTIRGERSLDKEYGDKEGFHRMEQSYGSFSRSFSLPSPVDTKAAKASYKDGVLKIRLPKTSETRKRSLDIE
jgi:HSP20 family protein